MEALPEPSEREQTKEAQLKEVHARMTENMGPVLGYIYNRTVHNLARDRRYVFAHGLAEP
jgi:hypothetical protein